MPPVRVIEEQPRARNRPVRQHLDQPPLFQKFGHAIPFKVIGNAKPVECCSDADIGMVGDDGTVYRNLHLSSTFLEFPTVVPAVHLEPPVDAGMLVQVGR